MQTENIEETPKEEVKELKHWQWIKGENSGDVVTFNNEGPIWITFNEGGRIATDLRDEFLQQLDPDIAGEFVKSNTSVIDPLNQSAVPVQPVQTVIVEKPISPIRVLFDKQKKNNKIKLTLQFPINIPSKGMYELMSSSFDSDEVKNELKDFIAEQLSKDEIIECLNNSIESLIESKYKEE
jgi:hypothetical protein|tara:strand:- start:40 stop:582 length:543 start_codon:yes stop_codon:yes gene_type:complete